PARGRLDGAGRRRRRARSDDALAQPQARPGAREGPTGMGGRPRSRPAARHDQTGDVRAAPARRKSLVRRPRKRPRRRLPLLSTAGATEGELTDRARARARFCARGLVLARVHVLAFRSPNEPRAPERARVPSATTSTGTSTAFYFATGQRQPYRRL